MYSFEKIREEISQYTCINEQELSDRRVMLDYMRVFPDIFLRSNEFAHMTASSFVMNHQLDKVLMVFHNIYNTWAWTGGHADGDYDLLSVALREASEETGIRELTMQNDHIMSIDILPVFGHMKKGNYVSAHLHLNVTYIFIAEENQTIMSKPDENSGVSWLPADRLKEYSNEPELIYVYEKLINKARKIKVI